MPPSSMPPKPMPVLKLEAALPLMTKLHVPVEIVVDGASAGAFPFTACNGRACIVLIQNNKNFLGKLRTSDALKMTFKMFNRQGVAIGRITKRI